MIADGFPFRSNEKHRAHILKFSRDLLRCVWWFLFGSVSGIINEGTHRRATINGGCHYFAKGVSVLLLMVPLSARSMEPIHLSCSFVPGSPGTSQSACHRVVVPS